MSTASQLAEQGVEKMRLPNWNEHAYLKVWAEGPWCELYDVLAGIGGGQPIPILLIDADKHNNWEPVT
jgi:hypothetical protein